MRNGGAFVDREREWHAVSRGDNGLPKCFGFFAECVAYTISKARPSQRHDIFLVAPFAPEGYVPIFRGDKI